jgi:hypothetical protein
VGSLRSGSLALAVRSLGPHLADMEPWLRVR